jgi:acetylornithine deacetylase/succinyl-diaminopimelate desuccinylase family protein
MPIDKVIRQKVLSTVDASQEETVALVQEMVRIPSVNPPGDERLMVEFLDKRLGGMGAQVETWDVHPGRPDLVATFKGTGERPCLVFNGHTDVVPPGSGWTALPYGGNIRDRRIYGRGATDMKGGIAAMIMAMDAMRKVGVSLRGTLKIAAVADEEETQAGTRVMVERGLEADFGIVGEPTELVPVIAHKGDFYFDITTRGKAFHGSMPDKGINAIRKMVKVIDAIDELAERLQDRVHPVVGPPTINVGTIHGGTLTCIVPDTCTIQADRRVTPSEEKEAVIQEMRDLLEHLRQDDPEFVAEMEMPVLALPMEIKPDEPIVKTLRWATEAVTGKDPGVGGWSATCDANYLVNDAHIPTVIFGPGSIAGQAHKPDEYIEIEELMQGTRVYALTLLELLT